MLSHAIAYDSCSCAVACSSSRSAWCSLKPSPRKVCNWPATTVLPHESSRSWRPTSAAAPWSADQSTCRVKPCSVPSGSVPRTSVVPVRMVTMDTAVPRVSAGLRDLSAAGSEKVVSATSTTMPVPGVRMTPGLKPWGWWPAKTLRMPFRAKYSATSGSSGAGLPFSKKPSVMTWQPARLGIMSGWPPRHRWPFPDLTKRGKAS
mmetsp:Transcript_28712/g.89285  ORF Transcript_28712/g.89285 Transcript_28712/m.89285 type:complete len:204 (-) Transcript_28712:915-1526(-)